MADHQTMKNGLKERARYLNHARSGSRRISRGVKRAQGDQGEDVKVEWEEQNGVWMDRGFSGAWFPKPIIEVDSHLFAAIPFGDHKHNEAIIIVLRGQGYISSTTSASTESGDTLISARASGISTNSRRRAAMVVAIKPLPIKNTWRAQHRLQGRQAEG